MPRWEEGRVTKRTCPSCGGRKDFQAKACRKCAAPQVGPLGKKGPAHPAWKGGSRIDRDGYIKTYAPDHPWPRKSGYVFEHVRVIELHIGRRLVSGEVVHHRDHDRKNNDLANLEILRAGEHSQLHRREDTHLRRRDASGRFAEGEVAREAAHRR
jgi:ribosomal protein L40E